MPGQMFQPHEDLLDWVLQVAAWPLERRWRLVYKVFILYVSVFVAFFILNIPVTFAFLLSMCYLAFASGFLGLPRAWFAGAIVGMIVLGSLLAIDIYNNADVIPLFGGMPRVPASLQPLFITLITFIVPLMISTIAGTFGSLIVRTQQEIQARRLTEAQYRLLIEETSDLAFIMSTSGRFMYISPSVYNLTGYKHNEIIGKHFLKVIDPEWREAVYEFYKEQYVSRLPETTFLLPIKRKDGEKRWIEQTVVAEFNGNDIMGFHALARDVTDRKYAEDELQAARDRAVMASRFKSQLLANVSHDLRTPLSTIMLISEMLQQGFYGEMNPEQNHRLQIIRDSGNMLMLLIKNLLDEAQLEAGKLELNVGAFPTEHLLAITTVLKPLIEQRGLKWEEEIDDDLPPMLYGDVERLKQVISNLTTNAAKFTHKGKVKLRIYQPDKIHWAFTISDTGRGIPEHMLDRVFDPFWQVDGSTTREKQSGVGLGLAIVKQLTERMGGTVNVSSVEGEGTCFTVTMPLPKQNQVLAGKSLLGERLGA